MKRKNKINKFFKIINFFIFFLLFTLKAHAENKENLIYIGKPEAPIKIKIFSSLTCPHCADFHIKIVPEIKKEYVETGKVQLIFVDFPLDQLALNAAKLLHCVKKDKQINFLDTIYKKQSEWVVGSNIDEINENLKKLVKDLGIGPNKFDKCLNDEIIETNILNNRIDGHKKYSIEATPTIIINEEKMSGSISFKNIEKKIKKLI